jgi:ABC-type multidrug transport system fused ATPase/permease subunit
MISALTLLEAQLFSGTVRDNMDPFNQHEDVEIWDALRECGLAGRTPGASLVPSRAVTRANSAADLLVADIEERVTIRSLDEGVAVGGKNFSE